MLQVTALMPSETSSQLANATNGIEPPRSCDSKAIKRRHSQASSAGLVRRLQVRNCVGYA